LDPSPPSLLLKAREKLWPHQKTTADRYVTTDRILDWSDPGTGKTFAHLLAFAERRVKGKGKALIIAPKTLLEPAWGADIRKFLPYLTYICAYAEIRAKAFEANVDIYLTNTDAATWLVKQKPQWFQKTFGEDATLIIDEITAFKHRKTKRSKAMARVASFFKYRAGLTGTPNPNSVQELWHQALIIDEGVRLGKSFFEFRNNTCMPVQRGPQPQHVEWVDRPGIQDVVGYMLRDITVRHDFDDVMDVPDNYQRHVSFDLPKEVLAKYHELENFAILELQEGNVTAINAASMRQKLLQIASGAVYGGQNEYFVLNTARYELILDLVEERDHSIVFFNWKHQRDELVKLAEKREVTYAVIDGDTPHKERNRIVKAYQDGQYQVLFLHPDTGAHGLTLTKGRATIWSSPVYRADWIKQGYHRIVRGGQTKKTETIFIEANGTIEHRVYERQRDKTFRMTDLLDIIKENTRGE
jgi:SNF2 family DNA or RNA helicase